MKANEREQIEGKLLAKTDRRRGEKQMPY